MKLRLLTVLWSVVLGGLALASVGNAAAATEQLWTCGMHPQIIKHEPGNCPICGMKLTPVRGKTGAAAANVIQIDAVIVQRMNVKTALVRRGPLTREIRTYGSVAFDESGLRDVTMKYDGWIERLFVNTTWAPVKAGDPLFEIYSPDLYNAQLNYVAVRGADSEGQRSVWTNSALGRLRLYDVPPEFIEQLDKTGKAQRTFVFRAPADGVVIEKSGVTGQMMKAGERIYRLADLSRVWVLAQVYEQDLPDVKPGMPATVRLTRGEERTYSGKVTLVVPQLDEQTRAAPVRIELPNPDGALRPGMYVDVRFAPQTTNDALLIPEPAILRSGERNTVFVAKDGGQFEARVVQVGRRSAEGDYEIVSGLSEGERVVTSGQFMLDSESQLREAIEKMSGAPVARTPNLEHSTLNVESLPATPELSALANATADAAAALAADDLAGYNERREAVNAALGAWSATSDAGGVTSPRESAVSTASGVGAPRPPPTALAQLPSASDLKSARDAFEPFSTAVTDLARAGRLEHTAGLHAFECPMPPSGGAPKARWLQRTAGTKNPFYGSAMPTCGEEIAAEGPSTR